MRIVFLGVVFLLLLPAFVTVAKTTEQETINNYPNTTKQPIHQLAPSVKTKVEDSPQHPIKSYSEKKKDSIASSTTNPIKKKSQQNYDPVQRNSKLTENSEEGISSSYIYYNTTFCTACRQDETNEQFYFEYNGTVFNLTYEITPYFRIDDEEPPGTFYNPGNMDIGTSIPGGDGNINSYWLGQTYSHTISYGAMFRTHHVIYILHTSTSYGNTIESTAVILTAVFPESPVLVGYPEDIIFSFDGIHNFELNWTATDISPAYYVIKQNGTVVDSDTFYSNQTVSYQGVTEQLSRGANEFTITFYDFLRNNVSHTVNVIATDLIPPAFERPNNLVYPVGATGNTVTWKPVDLSTPGSYTLLSPAETTSDTWNNDDEITANVDGLPIGVHNYTIIIRDSYGNLGKDTVLVTVYDPLPPEIIPVDSVTIEHGMLGNSISWTPIDSNPSHYTLKKDGIIIVQKQQWVSGEKVEVSLNDLPVGITGYEVIFYDQFERSVSDSVTVNVVDTTSPTITQELAQIIERDIIHDNPQFYYLNWLLTDLNPTVYTITVNDTFLRSAAGWQDGDEVLYFLSETELGTYNYTIIVHDLYGNTAQQSVEVVVQDTLSPAINKLSDKVYDYGNYNHSFSWIVTDGQPARYNITLNDTLFQEGIWDSNEAIEFSSIRPELGSYQFLLQIWDDVGNFVSDSFILRIRDSDTPSIVSPGSQLLELWTAKSIAWIATDSSGSGSYEISKNGEIIKLGSWVTGIPIELQVKTNVTGTYNYEILVKDTVGTVAIDKVTVTVFITSSASRLPEVADRTLEFGTTGEMLIWNPVNFNNGNYTITRNGQLIDANSYWLSKDPISVSLNNLNLGDHVYNLTILDFSGILTTDIVTVTVRDTIQPEVIASPEVEFSIATSQRFLHWKATDWHPGNYQFMLDMQLISDGSWINNREKTLQLSNHAVGTYNYTLIVLDQFNNSLSQIITVTVSDKLKPIINPVANSTYELGNEFPIMWLVTDDAPNYFQIYKNDSLLRTDFWETGSMVSVNLTGLSAGIYNYTLQIYDQSLNVASASVFVRIEDTTSPALEASDDLYLQAGQTGQAISWRVFDLQAGNYSLWKDGKTSQMGTWLSGETLTFTLTVATAGTHTYTLQVADSSMNMASSSIFVFVIDQLPPRISTIKTEFTLEYGSTGNELIWDVFEAGKWNYTIILDKILPSTMLNKLVTEGEVEANQVITQTVDGLELGTYLYSLAIVDSAQNTASKTIVVNVVDTTTPVLIEKPNIQVFNYKLIYYLNWSANDMLPGNYTILLDGTSVKSGIWESQDRINYTLTQFLPGEYNFTTIFYDSSRNLAYSSQIITIEDKILPLANFTENISYELTPHGYNLSWNVSDDFPEELLIVQNLYLSSLEISALNLSEIENSFNTPMNSEIESLHDLYQYLLTVEGAVLLHKQNYQNFVTISQIPSSNAESVSYTLLIYDQSKNLNYNSINISIIDTNNPEFTLIPNLTESETEFTWSATDMAPADYTIMINNSIHETGVWNSTQKIQISLNTLEPGFYEITIKIRDKSLNYDSYKFYLTKPKKIINNLNQETTTPKIVSTSKKIQYEMGSTINQIITWNRPGQSSNLQYQLFENGKIIRTSQVWPERVQLNINLNFLPTGIYNFTLSVNDVTGDYYRNITLVEIQDTTAPKIKLNHQNNAINSTSGNIVTVVKLSDINPEMYYVYLNNSLMNSDNWKNGEIFVINLNLQPGNYELFIIGYDSHANSVTERLTITVYSNPVSNTENNLSSLEIGTHYLWWLIIVAIAIAITLIAMRKTIEKKIKKNK